MGNSVQLFVTCRGYPLTCERIIAEPAQQDEYGRFILDKPGVWRLYARYDQKTIRAYIFWEEDGTWTLFGQYRQYFEVTPEESQLLVVTHAQPLGCYRLINLRYAKQDIQGRLVIDEPGAWEIAVAEGGDVYQTRLCVWDDGSWTFVDNDEGVAVLTE